MRTDSQGLLLSTRNPHKVAEIQAILGTTIKCVSLDDFPGAPEVVEDAPDFVGNAVKKSVVLARWLGDLPAVQGSLPDFVLADDSGLEVDALNGDPGVFSARFAALDAGNTSNSSSQENNRKLLRLMERIPLDRRTARFRCVLALTPVISRQKETASPVCYADELEFATETFQGECEGRIEFAPKGQGGFGYDPLFTPVGYNETFSELGEAVKNQLSHRAKALSKLRERLAKLAAPNRDDIRGATGL